MKVGELVYAILDLAKNISDDSTYTEEHVLFLCKKYRSLYLKREQDKEKASTDVASEFEYQQVCFDLEVVPAIDGSPCTGGYYLKTTEKLPKILEGTQPRVYPYDYFQGTNLVYVSRDRMRYVGTNPYLQSFTYVSLGPDLYLYLKSSNPQFIYQKKLRVSAVFEDFDEAAKYLCDSDGGDASCDVLDADFPIREYLVPEIIQSVLRDLLGASYRPADKQNNSSDDLSDIASYIRRNMKNGFQKQLED